LSNNYAETHLGSGVYPILSVSCELLCINWNEPQAAAYIIQAAFEQDLCTSWWMQTESARVSTRSE